MPIEWYFVILRLLIPLSILQWPLPGVIVSSLADMYDWKFTTIENDEDQAQYQFWDKFFDLYYWLFALAASRRWKDTLSKNIALGLFFYRIIGQTLFFLTGSRVLLLIFPNLFENFFILTELSLLLRKKTLPVQSKSFAAITAVLLIVPKIIHEYFQHFLKHQPWEIYNFAKMIGLTGIAEKYANYFIWGVPLYVIPFIAVLTLAYRISARAIAHTS